VSGGFCNNWANKLLSLFSLSLFSGFGSEVFCPEVFGIPIK
jgi:hypothetical protein